MAGTSSRMLRLLSSLQAHRQWRGAELADHLGVSTRTLRRDVERLRELGYVVDSSTGVEGGYRLRAGSALPPLAVDDDEAVALAVALQAAAEGAYPGMEDAAVRALGKVVQVMPPRLRHRVEALGAATAPATWGRATQPGGVDVTTLLTVAQACRDSERLRFSYTAREGARTERYVEPNRLVRVGPRWYLAAFDVDRGDWRTFRLDRVRDAAATGWRFPPRTPPTGDAAEFVRTSISYRGEPYRVRVDVAAPADVVRGRIGRWAQVDPAGEERSLVSMTTDELHWPAMALGMLGAAFTVLEPPEFTSYVKAWGERFSDAVTPGASEGRIPSQRREPGVAGRLSAGRP